VAELTTDATAIGRAWAQLRAYRAHAPYDEQRVRAAVSWLWTNWKAVDAMPEEGVIPAVEEAVPGITGREITDAIATLVSLVRKAKIKVRSASGVPLTRRPS